VSTSSTGRSYAEPQKPLELIGIISIKAKGDVMLILQFTLDAQMGNTGGPLLREGFRPLSKPF
jgi:hypothetical protein